MVREDQSMINIQYQLVHANDQGRKASLQGYVPTGANAEHAIHMVYLSVRLLLDLDFSRKESKVLTTRKSSM